MGDSAAPPSLPLLGMLVDRTSFDETDDYGIDRNAIDDTVPVAKLNVSTSTILKNGRVRRRLRWRPKRRNDGGARDSPADDPDDDGSLQQNGIVRSTSSNVSVNSHSNMSYSSRASNRSMHSFSSTQTMHRDNTKNSDTKARKFPLPRPNYPSTFDGVATIVSESTMVHARIKGDANNASNVSPSTVFAAADLESLDTLGDNPETEISQTSSTPKKRGFPPLFRRKPPTMPREPSMEWDISASKTPPMSPAAPRQTLSEPFPLAESQPTSLPPKTLLPSLSSKATLSTASTLSPPSTPRSRSNRSPAEELLENDSGEDLPSVEDEILVHEPRVDLRIPEHRQTESSKIDPKLEVREAIHTPLLPAQEKQTQAVVSYKPHSLKWSSSESAMASLADNCVDFLLSADPDEIEPSLVASEMRFSMSEVGHSFSEPAPPRPSQLPGPKPSVISRPPLPPSTTNPPISPSRLPRQPSFSLEPKGSEVKSGLPSSPTDDRSSPLPTIESQTSGDSRTSTPGSVDDGAFLDVEKNLQAIHDMGVEHLKHKEYPEALEVFEEILRGQLTRYGEEHYRVGTALHNIGIVHMKEGDYEEAAHVSYEAVRIRRLTLPEDHPDIAVSLAQLGVALLECRKFKKAISHFREALSIRRKCYGPKHLKVAKLLNNIGCALYELNELEVAKVAFEEALDIQRSTLREVPTQDLEEPANQILLSIASTLSNIGSIKLYWGRKCEAIIDLEEALLIQQSVLGDDHPFAKRTEECLVWMESKVMHSVDDDDVEEEEEENSVAAVAPDSESKGRIRFCTSTAISVDQPHEELMQLLDLFNRNFWSFKSGIALTCQGGEPLIHETPAASSSNSSEDIVL